MGKVEVAEHDGGGEGGNHRNQRFGGPTEDAAFRSIAPTRGLDTRGLALLQRAGEHHPHAGPAQGIRAVGGGLLLSSCSRLHPLPL